jgi:hypothetical protein
MDAQSIVGSFDRSLDRNLFFGVTPLMMRQRELLCIMRHDDGASFTAEKHINARHYYA